MDGCCNNVAYASIVFVDNSFLLHNTLHNINILRRFYFSPDQDKLSYHLFAVLILAVIEVVLNS